MAGKQVDGLSALPEFADADLIPIYDDSEAGTEKLKKVTVAEFKIAMAPTLVAFNCYNSGDQSNITAGGGYTTIIFDTERFDYTDNFATNTFTAPVDGLYLISWYIKLAQVDSDSTLMQFGVVTTGQIFTLDYQPQGFDQDLAYHTLTGNIICEMSATDTSYLRINQWSGANQMDIKAGSHFMGHILSAL